ncbi:DUF362 domain-containing protein [candidate division KSB1 bacterium]|nr:DUF362 domain-containing protein [candidate division KSB1 bacterium]
MKKALQKLFFQVIGLGSLIWFLVRVIPKPSRAAYPCMRASFPVASAFVLYIAGLLSSLVAFKKAKKYLYESKYILFSIALIIGISLGLATYLKTDKRAYALVDTTPDGPNNPMGEGKGIFPGRVVWIYNPDVTNENCNNTWGDYWYMDSNCDQEIVDQMVSEGLQTMTGTTTDADAWDAIFHYYNKTHNRGDVDYTAGEKIVIKINLNGLGNWTNRAANINTSPQLSFTILKQLIDVAGVAQADISIGDPNIDFDTPHWDKCHPVYPNVHYWGTSSGRTVINNAANRTASKVLIASDGSSSAYLPQAYIDATYLINLPVFKKHHRAGISLTSKNHFGTLTGATNSVMNDWHFSLPAPLGGGNVTNDQYGVYRCFVDIMGHKDLGAKTILYLVDGIWGSINWGHPAIKWRMAPFNNDWPSSLFFSQDPVAIQSVGFDFLFHEFDQNHPTEGAYDPRDDHGPFSHYGGSDDFLHQAADPANWPDGFTYDPENDGNPLQGMGTHEHWNNATEMKYSRNLGLDKGIELVKNFTTAVEKYDNSADVAKAFRLNQNFPNPFNPSTQISYHLKSNSHVTLTIFNMTGQEIRTLADEQQAAGAHIKMWDGLMANGVQAPSGEYIYRLIAKNDAGMLQQAKKMILRK